MSAAKQDIKSIFGQAMALSLPQERAAYLRQACAGNPALQAEIESLLQADRQAGSFLGERQPCPVATVDDPISERPGTVIGPYKLMEQIGEGGMGLVFVAEQQEPIRRKVALKVIKPGMDTRQVVARFEAERQALALMDHPNIAKVLDGGTTDSSRPYFVMELVKGVPITEFCDQNQLPIRQRLELFNHVCQAVQHAHQKGIIHRDLKPSNVLVVSHDGTPVVKVIDFGVAKAIGRQLTEKTIYTQFSQMVGTPLYMSPEQAGQSGLDVDTRSDIYSLGVLLYELLTGMTPFDRERMRELSCEELRRIIREEEPPKPSTRIRTLGKAATTVSAQRQSEPKQLSRLMRGELDWIVMKGLEKDRNRRYETANSFALDVQRYLHDEAVLACPPSAVYRFRKFARRNRGRLALAAAVLLAVLLGGGGWLWRRLDREARLARNNAAIYEAVNRAATLREQAREAQGRAASLLAARAREQAQRAEALVESGPADGALTVQVRQLLVNLEADAKDAQLLAALDAARMAQTKHLSKENLFAKEQAVPLFREAFRAYGMAAGEGEATAVAARLNERPAPVRMAALAAVAEWIALAESAGLKVDEPHLPWLRAVQEAAEPEGWGKQFREAVAEKELAKRRAALEKLAATADVDRLPALALTRLANYLQIAQAEPSGLALLQRAQPRHADDFWIHSLLANLLWRQKQPAEALRYQTAAAALRPDSAGTRMNLSLFLRDLGKLDEAIAEGRKAIELDSKYTAAHHNLAILLASKGQVDEAIACYKKAIELNPKEPWVHYNLAMSLASKGQVDEAIACYKKAIELNPKLAWPHNNLAVLLIRKGQLDEAIAEYQKAIELDPKLTLAHRSLLRLLLGMGRLDKAIAAYHNAIALNPDLAKELGPDEFPAGYYIRLSQWDKAAAEFPQADWALPRGDSTFTYACLFLIRGDSEGYNRFCQRMIQPATQKEARWNPYVLARTCAIARKSPVDPARAVQWANQVVASAPAPWHYHVLGLAQYRAGQFDEALQSFTKANVKRWNYRELNWFPLALVHHRLGHPDEARQCLAKGIQWLERVSPPSPERPAKLLPQDWIEAQLLRREVEEMLKNERIP